SSEHDDAVDPQTHDGRVVDAEAPAGKIDDVAVIGVRNAGDRLRAGPAVRDTVAGARCADVTLEIRVARVRRGDEVRLHDGEPAAGVELQVFARLPGDAA